MRITERFSLMRPVQVFQQSTQNICVPTMSTLSKKECKVEGGVKIDDFSFEKFQGLLEAFRKRGSEEILQVVGRDNLQSTMEGNYKACVDNFKERMDLLDNFTDHLKKKQSELEEAIRTYKQDSSKKEDEMVATGKLKNTEFFIDYIDVERKREEFYKKRAMEKYMENYLDIKTFNKSDNH